MRKSLIALAAVVVPLIIVFFVIGLNIKIIGTPKGVIQVWLGGIAYWVVAIVTLIVSAILRRGSIVKGIGIGVGIGFIILIVATGLQL